MGDVDGARPTTGTTRRSGSAGKLVNKATESAGASGAKGAMDRRKGHELLGPIAEIDRIFLATKPG